MHIFNHENSGMPIVAPITAAG